MRAESGQTPDRPRGALPRTAALIGRLEDSTLALLLLAMIALATLQIVLRNVFGTGVPWIGPALRYMVLWLGLLGALCAARSGEHIAIDALTRALPEGLRLPVRIAASVFTVLVCSVVAVHGARLVFLDREAGSMAFSGIPSWCLESAIPLCFGGIALRYALRIALDLRGDGTAHPS